MFKDLQKSENWLAGFQWFFFIFANIVIIPLTIGKAFDLSDNTIMTTLQYSFVVTGAACIAQAFWGHKRAILEGQSGLWWGMILTTVSIATSQGISLAELGGSLTVGVLISALLTVLTGVFGLGSLLSRLFKPAVMGVFMMIFGFQLIQIFLKGMLGIPMGNAPDHARIDLNISLISMIMMLLIIIVNVMMPSKISKYSLLLGIVVGWGVYSIFLGEEETIKNSASFHFEWFSLGNPAWNVGIIIVAVITGILNLANTFGALKGTEGLYKKETSKKQYRASLMISGFFTAISGVLGLVPYAPFVSSIGFLKQAGIINRLPFIIGGFLFLLMGVIPPVAHFFSDIPLSVGSTVLFVSYLQLLLSSFEFFEKVPLNKRNIYRCAVPIFLAVVVMTLPSEYFSSFPSFIQPFISNGLLVGITLSLILENIMNWDRIQEKMDKKVLE
ncbi:uracil/xanthine transporter [Paenibacillus polygoni]|uniref:Uracil/xanthine transporter n=1 Tax=Paenibacillus polygoni TaxID=3050112 RepID=A0ABY8WWM1_9BACL|nr:uracil/xanthine transporter [Paenibacillus polygoni]WIV17316.1 uracil/xanthine transporter [Paenibacillus polygoni]